ncbi:hypothetical protein [uncultured Polaribacter sp.]|uniref:hypothetical protein n=1 Tax=uncultured Polaribacter sp. TaxID=174711 RepID=UPI00260F4F7F|nr:hypothetical protein [uncultured Polaribacter sp.]
MKKQNLRFLTLTLLIGILVYSCQKEDEFVNEEISSIQQTKPENITKLGNKLENPFSVTNMQRALDTILKEVKKSKSYQAKSFQKSAEQIEIKKTDLYVRFLPKDSLELNIIEKDTTIVLYDHPLDYEIEEQGEYYHDPELPEDQISWRYTVVKPDYEFPEIQYEVLSDLFIPENSEGYFEEEDTNLKGKSTYSKTNSLGSLETVSLYLTNNLTQEEKQEIEKDKKKNLLAKRVCVWFICWNVPDRWNPSGTIKLWDDRLNNYYPMQGVNVRARRWFTTKTDITDSNGKFETGSFRRPANYSIKWERHHFSVKWSWWLFWSGTARYNGPKQKSAWNLNIKGGTQQYYATVFQAAHDYYYKYSYGLTKPSRWGGFWKMRIRARLKNGTSSYVKARRLWNGSDISLQAWGDPSDLVYGTTIHELAHAAHRKVDGSAYNSLVSKGYSFAVYQTDAVSNSAKRVMETWATTVEIALTNLRYKSYLRDNNFEYGLWKDPSTNNRQNFPLESQPIYTSLGYDLMDNTNQRIDIEHDYVGTYAQDRVSGYSIKQVENSLKGTNSWGEWKENIKKQNPNNSTKKYIDELFNNW